MIVDHNGGSPKPMLFHFLAEGSGACRRMETIIDEVAEEFEGHVEVLKVDFDESRVFAFSMGICEVPALVMIKQGQPRRSRVGLQTRRQLADFLLSSM